MFCKILSKPCITKFTSDYLARPSGGGLLHVLLSTNRQTSVPLFSGKLSCLHFFENVQMHDEACLMMWWWRGIQLCIVMQVARIVSTLTQDTSAPRGIVCRCVGNNLALIIPRRRRRWTAATAKPTPNHRLSSLRPSDGRSDLIHFGSRVYRRFRLIVLSYWDQVIVNFQTY